jgi:hypothetical protein
MASKSRKKAAPWPTPQSNDDPDLRAFAAALLKDVEIIGKHHESVEKQAPRELSSWLLSSLSKLAKRVRDAPTNEVLARRLAKVENFMEKTQKEVSQASRDALISKNNTNRLVDVICQPSPPGTRILKSAGASHVTGSSESYVQGWGRRVPSHLSTVPSGTFSSTSSTPQTPTPSQEDLEIYLERTDPDVVNPLRRHLDQVIGKANQAIQSTQDPTIAHRRFVAARILPSGDTALLANSVGDVDQLTRKSDWIRAFGEHARIRIRTWGVVVRGVDTTIDPRKPHFTTTLRSDNAAVFAQLPAPINITYTGWLLGERKLKEQDLAASQLIVMFDDERVANFAIQRGLIIKGKQHECMIYDKSINLQQCFRCQMYKHIARHCRRQACCAYCAEAHETGVCTNPHNKEHARCANCIEENKHIKDPTQKLDIKHYAYARECPIRATCLTNVHQQRTHGPQFHGPVIRSGNTVPGITADADPTPAEAAAGERSPRTTTRTSSQRRAATSRSKSNARKRAAEPESPAASSKPTTRSSKKAMHIQKEPVAAQDDVMDDRAIIVYEDPKRRRKATNHQSAGEYQFVGDLQESASQLDTASVEALPMVRCSRSNRPVIDDDDDSSVDVLSLEAPEPEPTDILMTTNLEDSRHRA